MALVRRGGPAARRGGAAAGDRRKKKKSSTFSGTLGSHRNKYPTYKKTIIRIPHDFYMQRMSLRIMKNILNVWYKQVKKRRKK